MKLDNKLKELLVFLAIISAIIGAFLTFYFGIAGLKVFIGIIMMSLPFCILLNAFEIAEGEKFILSLIFGITLFPSFAYLLGFFISFRMAIAAVLVLLIGASLLWNYLRSRKN